MKSQTIIPRRTVAADDKRLNYLPNSARLASQTLSILRRLTFILLLLASLHAACAATIRIINIDLTPSSGLQSDNQAVEHRTFEAIATSIRELEPDFIFLQGVRDWNTCNDLAQVLKPAEFRVVICSSFPAVKSPAKSSGQTAILTRHNTVFSWSEPWKIAQSGSDNPSDSALLTTSSGGFAFAVVDIRGVKYGCFSAIVPNLATTPYADPARQIVAQVATVKRWEKNRPTTFLIGGNMDPALISSSESLTIQALQLAGFAAIPPQTSVDSGQSDQTRLLFAPDDKTISARTIAKTSAIRAWEITIDPTAVATSPKPAPPKTLAPKLETPESFAPTSNNLKPHLLTKPPTQASGPTLEARSAYQNIAHLTPAIIAVALLALLFVAYSLYKKRIKPSTPRLLIPAPFSNPNYVVMAPQPRDRSDQPALPDPVVHIESEAGTQTHTWQQSVLQNDPVGLRNGLMPHFQQWLKEKFIRKLITDREHLIESQQRATTKAMAVDDRLARIEHQVQEQHKLYQLQIDALTRELSAARDENRELLRARIAQVKAEMAAARARIIASSDNAAAS